jgi:hypothetical protein
MATEQNSTLALLVVVYGGPRALTLLEDPACRRIACPNVLFGQHCQTLYAKNTGYRTSSKALQPIIMLGGGVGGGRVEGGEEEGRRGEREGRGEREEGEGDGGLDERRRELKGDFERKGATGTRRGIRYWSRV